MNDDALSRAKRALQVVPRQTGVIAPVDKAKVNDLIARAREASINRPSVPATIEPRKTVATVEPAQPIEKARELGPAERNRAPASSPFPAMPERQPEPPPAVPAQAAAPNPPAAVPQTVYVPVPTPVWGYWGPGWWACPPTCPLLRGKRRCRPCGI